MGGATEIPPPAAAVPNEQQLPAAVTNGTAVAAPRTSNTTSSSSSNKKSTKVKEAKKTMRLKLTEKTEANVVSCLLITSAGQAINFRFSLAYDKPKEIFQNFVSSYSVKHISVSVHRSKVVIYNNMKKMIL